MSILSDTGVADTGVAATALADFIGLDVCLGVMRVLDDGLDGDHFRPPQVLLELVAAGHLGQKTGQGFHAYPRPERSTSAATDASAT